MKQLKVLFIIKMENKKKYYQYLDLKNIISKH